MQSHSDQKQNTTVCVQTRGLHDLQSVCCTEASICSQPELLQLSTLSADLDLLNELSCSLTLGDDAARRLRHINQRWTDTSARAEEMSRSINGGRKMWS